MKKSIGLALAAVLCISGVLVVEGSSPFAASEEVARSPLRSGKDAILDIRKGYGEGRYDSFFKEMDASYEGVLENGQIGELANLRQGEISDLQWMDAVQALQKQKNEELLQVVSGQDSVFAEKVRAIATPDSLSNLFLKIHQMAPGTGKNQDENTLIALDLEYEYKAIHLNTSEKDSRDLYYALKMEQMDKMLLASQSFEDETLKGEVLAFAQNFDDRLAKNWDQMDLRSLMLGKVSPKDQTEQKVVSILKDHYEKVSGLQR